jgi:hypothetical protein
MAEPPIRTARRAAVSPMDCPRFGFARRRARAAAALVLLASASCSDAVGPAESIRVVSGDQQAVVAGSLFPQPIRVTLLDAKQRAAAGTLLRASVSGGGWVVEDSVVADPVGAVDLLWYAGPDAAQSQELVLTAGSAAVTIRGDALPPVAGTTYRGLRGWVEYTPGTLPIVLTAPHGGTQSPSDIPDRTGGTLVRDLGTDTLALRVAEALEARTGGRPHLIRLLLHRVKLDANREIVEAAEGNALAERAWHEFQLWTAAARSAVVAAHGEGFYFDLHGHGHDIQRLELGYLLSAAELSRTDAELNQAALVQSSSLRTLAGRVGRTHAELLRGPASLGAFFEAEGYPAVPSPAQPNPGSQPYFTGGYNTETHSCVSGGTVCGFQLEANRQGVRSTPDEMRRFGESTARVLERFFLMVYGKALRSTG